MPRPGGAEQLRNLAGRVLGQRLDMAKPLWEIWLVEGLEDDRWALISKVHHCMVDGVAGNDLMQTVFDADPDAGGPRQRDWQPEPEPSTAAVLAGSLRDGSAPGAAAGHAARRRLGQPARQRAGTGGSAWSAAGTRPAAADPGGRPLNGSIGPHRRWSWTRPDLDEVKRVRAGSAAPSTTSCWPRSPAASATCSPTAAS